MKSTEIREADPCRALMHNLGRQNSKLKQLANEANVS